MLDDIQKDARLRMHKSVQAAADALKRIRTGRATTSLLDHLQVEYYGVPTPLNQVATIAVADARTLSVQAWETQSIPNIEKAILESDLGLNPITAGDTMRIPLPQMNAERRAELAKMVKREGESGKVAVRNVRRDAINTLRDLRKEKEIGEDAEKRAANDLQTLTDKKIAEIDELVNIKEAEVLEV